MNTLSSRLIGNFVKPSSSIKQPVFFQWNQIFPNETTNTTQSTLFVKKLVAVAVSNVTYLRAIFPENAFGDRCLDGNTFFPYTCSSIGFLLTCALLRFSHLKFKLL